MPRFNRRGLVAAFVSALLVAAANPAVGAVGAVSAVGKAVDGYTVAFDRAGCGRLTVKITADRVITSRLAAPFQTVAYTVYVNGKGVADGKLTNDTAKDVTVQHLVRLPANKPAVIEVIASEGGSKASLGKTTRQGEDCSKPKPRKPKHRPKPAPGPLCRAVSQPAAC